jgi:putative transposase
MVVRARIVLAAAEGQNNAQIARTLGVTVDTVRLWRGRWQGLQGIGLPDLSAMERLTDAPRAGAPARITAEQVCRLVALACEAPQAVGRPVSQWSRRELATEAVQRGIVDRLSPRHLGRLLKRGTSNPIVSGTG